MISGGQNVDIMLVFISFSEMRVFSQVSFLNDFFEKSKGEKRTWANPMSSKQWKSLYEIENLTFLCVHVLFRFLLSMKNDDVRSPFGVTILVETVIFIKIQGSNYSCW